MDNKLNFFASMILSKKVLKVVFAKQDFKIPEQKNNIYVGSIEKFHVSPSYINEWNDLLGSENAQKPIPYTYYWPWGMTWMMKDLFIEAGINLRNTLHVGHETEISKNIHKIADSDCVIKQRLLDICPLNKNKIVLIALSVIETSSGEILYKTKNHCMVLNMKDSDIELLKESEDWDFENIPYREESFRKKESLFIDSKNCDISTFQCKKDIASKFGMVSGALSVTHANPITSKFFRQGKVFLQGVCTGNIIMKHLWHELGEDIKSFNVFFTNQLAFPQRIETRYNDTRFEVFDESNTMVAFGSRTLRKAEEAVKEDEVRKVA